MITLGAQASCLPRARETPLADVAMRARTSQQISCAKFVCRAPLANGKQDACAPSFECKNIYCISHGAAYNSPVQYNTASSLQVYEHGMSALMNLLVLRSEKIPLCRVTRSFLYKSSLLSRKTMNWIEVYSRLFEIINEQGANYFKGPRYLNIVREFEPYFLEYYDYIKQLREQRKSDTRKDYFREIFFSFSDERKISFTKRILRETETHNPSKTSELYALLGKNAMSPNVMVPDYVWNSEKLNGYLEQIDTCITEGDHKRAITLSYTSLEGFFRAFIEHKVPEKNGLKELLEMSREIQKYIKGAVPAYPDEALKLINHISHTIDKSRNSFSEAHFGNDAEKWLSNFIRDCTNSLIRLLLCFM